MVRRLRDYAFFYFFNISVRVLFSSYPQNVIYRLHASGRICILWSLSEEFAKGFFYLAHGVEPDVELLLVEALKVVLGDDHIGKA